MESLETSILLDQGEGNNKHTRAGAKDGVGLNEDNKQEKIRRLD